MSPQLFSVLLWRTCRALRKSENITESVLLKEFTSFIASSMAVKSAVNMDALSGSLKLKSRSFFVCVCVSYTCALFILVYW